MTERLIGGNANGGGGEARAARSLWGLLWRRFLDHHLAVASGILLIVLAALAMAAPLIEAASGIDAKAINLFNRFQGPSLGHPLGTDELGRDLFLRLLYGGQVSLFVGFVAALVSAVIGTVIGLWAGYYGGRLDAVLMRLTDGVIALPLLPLLIVLAAVDLNKLGLPTALIEDENISLYRIVVIIALVGWTTVARLVRGAALTVREREFVLAATAQGAGGLRIMTVHILPNVISPIIVATTLSVGSIILLESVLSFLGLGVPPSIPTWGSMLSESRSYMYHAPWLMIFPGMAIFITVLGINLLGDGLRDILDPKLSRTR